MSSRNLFISYSHADEELKNEFTAHLAPLESNGQISSWHDREIIAGDQIFRDIESALLDADMVVFLISSDFLKSISCYKKELKKTLERFENEEHVDIIPVILRNCHWQSTDIKEFMVVPKDGTPIVNHENRDDAWVEVIHQIAKRLNITKDTKVNNVESTDEIPKKKLTLKSEFRKWLEGMEIAFQHSQKERLSLADIYIYPDLKGARYRNYEKSDIVDSQRLLSTEFLKDGVIIEGEEQTGKTSLIKMIYSEHLKNGLTPVFAEANRIKTTNLRKLISKLLKSQYKDLSYEKFIESSRSRILIIDDYQELGLNKKYENKFLSNVREVFDYYIFVADNTLSHDEQRMAELAACQRWEILEFGNTKRGELIERWNILGQEETIEDSLLFKRIDEMTRNMDSIIGKNILPPKPIFLLTIIQSLETFIPSDFKLTSHGHCYQMLILQALHRVGIDKRNFDTFVNYLTELAYFCFTHGGHSITLSDFGIFKREYSEQYLLESHKKIVDTLKESEILLKDEDGVRFAYRYMYYFYAGKYISDHLSECMDDVHTICQKIHLDRNANILIFVMHHSRNQSVIDEIIRRSKEIFSDVSESSLNRAETDHMLELIEALPELVMEQQRDVASRRKRKLAVKDKFDDRSLEESEQQAEDEEELTTHDKRLIDIRKSSKTIDVVGQILRNRSGSLRKNQLIELTNTGFGSGLRFLGFWLDTSKRDKEQLVSIITEILKNYYEIDGDLDDSKTHKKIEKLATKIYLRLSYDVCRAVITRISNSLGDTKLVEIYRELESHSKDSLSIPIINITIHMEFKKQIPRNEIISLLPKLESNPIVKMLLKELVVRHIYFNAVELNDMQWISDKLDIPIKTQRLISMNRDGR
ncbi:MAG: toll/interleukin-1 receptor domain-containing protein [Gammaproteobacteria bacterium]|nr:toll/interleukin-1 receptor domain-containing protein [Gammaproteobacteria bacterium]